jgi:hypothetical protein
MSNHIDSTPRMALTLEQEERLKDLITAVLAIEFVALEPGKVVPLHTTAPVTYEGLREIFLMGFEARHRMMPDWLSYSENTDTLTIHGKRYAAGLFGSEGFLSPVGTLLRIVDGVGDVVTVERIAQETING